MTERREQRGQASRALLQETASQHPGLLCHAGNLIHSLLTDREGLDLTQSICRPYTGGIFRYIPVLGEILTNTVPDNIRQYTPKGVYQQMPSLGTVLGNVLKVEIMHKYPEINA